jgi:putative Ca2+/H+ antiporter (TMEM165/GDT1 family)
MSIKFLTWLSTYVIIVLCELGDKTQVAVLLLTSKNPSRRWLIFAASAVALVLCVIIEVTVGVTLARYLGPAAINRIAGVIFLILGVATLVSVVNTGSPRLSSRANLAEEGHNSI